MIAIIVSVISSILFATVVIYFSFLKPGHYDRKKTIPFKERYVARRGLYTPYSDEPENSMSAFRKAIENDYNIEFDVRVTKDGKVIVFNDSNTFRMCGAKKDISKVNFIEIQRYRLENTKETIPLLVDVLKLIKTQVPIIVNIKESENWKKDVEKISYLLDQYNGIYCVASTDPKILWWYKKNNPKVIRCQIASNYFKNDNGKRWFIKFVRTNLLTNFISRPNFIAYDHRYSNQFSYLICKNAFKVENIAWVIRSQEELENARSKYQCFIFDSFIPEN